MMFWMSEKTVVRRKHVSRDIRRELAARVASDQIGPVEKGMELFGLTKGNFSFLDIILHVLATVSRSGPVDMTISAWTVGNYDVGSLYKVFQAGGIASLRFIVDKSFQERQPEYCAAVREYFGDHAIRVTVNHAKFATLMNEDWNITIRTSMNLNENRRVEFFEISDDAAMCKFLDEYASELFKTHEPGSQFAKGAYENILDFEQLGTDISREEAERRAADGEQRKLYFGDGPHDTDLRRAGWSSAAGKIK